MTATNPIDRIRLSRYEGLTLRVLASSAVTDDGQRCADCGHLPGCGCPEDCEPATEGGTARKTYTARKSPASL
jgi:hypothetical protein